MEVPADLVAEASRPLTGAIGQALGGPPPVFDGAVTITRSADDIAEIWLSFDTGEEMAAPERLMVGRDPVAGGAGDEPTVLLPITDPDLSVSKTHLVFETDWDGVWVTDRGSTNGTQVEAQDGRITPVKPNQRVKAVAGSTVWFGTRAAYVTARTKGT